MHFGLGSKMFLKTKNLTVIISSSVSSMTILNLNYQCQLLVTAAYVAVATNVSVLLARIAKDIIAANSVTVKETATKLLVLSIEGRLIISIGNISAAPPVKPMMN